MRAKETADIIAKELPILLTTDPILRDSEGRTEKQKLMMKNALKRHFGPPILYEVVTALQPQICGIVTETKSNTSSAKL